MPGLTPIGSLCQPGKKKAAHPRWWPSDARPCNRKDSLPSGAGPPTSHNRYRKCCEMANCYYGVAVASRGAMRKATLDAACAKAPRWLRARKPLNGARWLTRFLCRPMQLSRALPCPTRPPSTVYSTPHQYVEPVAGVVWTMLARTQCQSIYPSQPCSQHTGTSHLPGLPTQLLTILILPQSSWNCIQLPVCLAPCHACSSAVHEVTFETRPWCYVWGA